MHRDSKMASTLVTILALAALPLAACKKPAGEGPGGGAPVALTAESAAPVRVTLATAQARQVPDVLSATGTLVPDQQSQVTALVPGRVTAVLVERGAQVREGDAMLRLRDTDYRANAATATAAVGQARARLGLDGTSGRFDPEAAAEVRAASMSSSVAAVGSGAARPLKVSVTLTGAGSAALDTLKLLSSTVTTPCARVAEASTVPTAAPARAANTRAPGPATGNEAPPAASLIICIPR